MKKLIVSLLFSLLAANAYADEALLIKNLKKMNNGRFADANIQVLRPVPIPAMKGFYEVTLDSQALVVHESGLYAIIGDVYNLDNMTNLSVEYRTKHMSTIAKKEIAKFRESDFITFKPRADKIGTLYVFSDTTCDYCKKLHNEVEELQAAGVEVKYISYPRGGINEGSRGYEQAKQMMCADDKQKAITELKSGIDAGKYVKEQYNEQCVESVKQGLAAGEAIGITGTPFIYLSTGISIRGYQPSAAIIEKFKAG
jgi:thiol:disulfide interchange protein DsbC